MRFRLIPSDQSFYDLFDQAVDNLAACIDALSGALGDDQAFSSIRHRIADLEHVGDDLLTETMKRLDSSFVTPIDREDISRLASRIDDVVDSVHHIAELMAVTGIPSLTEFALLVDLLKQAASETVGVVKALRTYKGIRERSERISALESEADALYRQALAHLFDGTFSTLDIIKSKDVIDAVEQAMDEIEDVGDTCESIFVKYA
jgi:uncharacterized protein